jgi:hypothetical protein
MDTSKMWPEMIISGFFYLTAFSFLLIRMLGLNVEQLVALCNGSASLGAGSLGLVSALAIGGAYLFGHLAGRLMTDLFEVVGKPLRQSKNAQRTGTSIEDEKLVQLLRGNPSALAEALHDRWIAKYFYRSMLGGIFLLGIASAPSGICSPNPRVSVAAWVLGGGLEVAFFFAFWMQRKSHSSLLSALSPPAERP